MANKDDLETGIETMPASPDLGSIVSIVSLFIRVHLIKPVNLL